MLVIDMVDILKHSRELLTHKCNWTIGVFARDKNGCTVSPVDPTASCFCSLGALCKVGNWIPEKVGVGSTYYVIADELSTTARSLGYNSLVQLNNNASHEEVLKMFDLTIQRLGN